jgi:hypothetical protein
LIIIRCNDKGTLKKEKDRSNFCLIKLSKIKGERERESEKKEMCLISMTQVGGYVEHIEVLEK